MKIAFDHQIFTMQSYGGISRYYSALGKSLFELEQKISIFCSFYQNNYLGEFSEGVVQGKKLEQYPPKTNRFFMWVNGLAFKKSMCHWNPDVIHETYYHPVELKNKVCPVVVTVYDMIHELFPESFSSKDKTSRYKKLSVDRADHVICISQSTKNDLVRLFGIAEGKVSVVYLGVEKKSTDHKAYVSPSASHRPYLLYVGNRQGYKNFSGFVKAFCSSPRLMDKFNIIAFGGGDFSKDELELFWGLGLNKDQVLYDSGDDKKLARLYASASAFVYPSLYEGFGLPPLEAMSYGCAVISSNSSSMPEVIGNAAEFFNPLCIDQMRDAMENVLFSQTRIEQLKILGYARIKDFSWEKCAIETLNVYQGLVNK